MLTDRILALLVGGPVRAVLTGAAVLSPIVLVPALLFGWWGAAIGAGVIVAGVVASVVWTARQPWSGRPRPW